MLKRLLWITLSVGTLFAAEEPFVTCDLLHAQLGNQCFQIAATLALAWDHDATPLFPDLIAKEEQLNIAKNRKQVFCRLDPSSPDTPVAVTYQEPHFHYDPIPYSPNMQIRGYFQSERYFRHHKEEIMAIFAPQEKIISYLTKKYGDLLAYPCTVAIHVRTYGKADPEHKAYPLNGREYVKRAMGFFPEDTHFLVFSDDIGWCEEHLEGLSPHLHFIEGEKYYHDFYLMGLCDHNIISNSSFSWWGAYLNQNPDKVVIAPKRWFQPSTGLSSKDLIPEDWIVIE